MAQDAEENKDKKSPLTYSIVPRYESEIRQFVDETNDETGISKSMIVSDLLVNAIRKKKKDMIVVKKICQ
mgnify:FL=1